MDLCVYRDAPSAVDGKRGDGDTSAHGYNLSISPATLKRASAVAFIINI